MLPRISHSERVTGKPEVMPPGWQIAPDKNGLVLTGLAKFRLVIPKKR